MNDNLTRFPVGGDPGDLDLDAVRVVRDGPTHAYVELDILTEDLAATAPGAFDPAAPVLHLDVAPDARYPIWIVGELGAEFSRDEAVYLARALLALAREHDVLRR